MLVLQRKKGQALMIGDDIKISVVEVSPDGVRLAIDAPKSVKILREELVEATAVNKQSVIDGKDLQSVKSLLFGKTDDE